MNLSCLQIFAGNPRGWKKRPLDLEEAALFADAARKADLDPVVVHASYLLNLASPDDTLWKRSCDALTDELCRAGALGARAVVVHPGSRQNRGSKWGIGRMAEAVKAALESTGGGVECWLENTAGGGGHLGGTLGELDEMLGALNGFPVGVCIDTAHAWGAGYALNNPEGVGGFLDLTQQTVGLDAVKLWHFNDSMVALGSLRDQHNHLGKGYIGALGFKSLIRDFRLAQASVIMETPKNSKWADRRNLAFIRRALTEISKMPQ